LPTRYLLLPKAIFVVATDNLGHLLPLYAKPPKATRGRRRRVVIQTWDLTQKIIITNPIKKQWVS
jgi:hypothetical protein